MRVISKARLRDFWERHPAAKGPLTRWYKAALAADWTSLQDVRRTFPRADGVRLPCDLVVTVFDVAGNNCRVITRIFYEQRLVHGKVVLTHPEYDRGNWKVQLCHG